MTVLDKLALALGRARGSYAKGIESTFSLSGARASAGDPTAFLSSTAWGQGLLNTRKPKAKEDCLNHFNSWVYICTRLNAQAVASVPLRLYVSKEEAGNKLHFPTKSIASDTRKWLYSRADLDQFLTKSEVIEEITEHPFLDLMRNVNPHHNSRDLMEFTVMYGDLTGESYSLIVRDSLNVPIELWPIPSQYINPIFGKNLNDAIKGYLYERGSNKVELTPEQVLHIPNPSPFNIFTGFSSVLGIADAVYIQSQMYETEAALFENRARPGGILTSADNISKTDRDRLKEDFRQKFEGSKKAGKTLVLPKGMDFKLDAVSPKELNYIESRKEIAREIMAALNVPEGMFDKGANRATAEQSERHHAKHGVLPRCDRISQKYNERLLGDFGGDTTKVFVAFDNPVPDDRELLLAERQGYQKMGLPLNRILAEMGEEPVEGGDVALVDSSLKPLEQVLEPPQPVPAQIEPEELAERAIKVVKEKLGG